MTQILNAEFLRAFRSAERHEVWFRLEARTNAQCGVLDIECLVISSYLTASSGAIWSV